MRDSIFLYTGTSLLLYIYEYNINITVSYSVSDGWMMVQMKNKIYIKYKIYNLSIIYTSVTLNSYHL